MTYLFKCENSSHGFEFEGVFCNFGNHFEIEASIKDGPPSSPKCPSCFSNEFVRRIYQMPNVIYNGPGFSKDYFSKNPGRNQSWDKLQNLNENWSRHFGTKPPPPDSKGTYDGT